MATLYSVLHAIQQQISSVTQGLISTSPDTNGVPLNVEVGLYWPSARALQNNVKKVDPSTGNLTAIITIYDRGLAADSTRWAPAIVGGTVTPSTVTVTINGVTIVGISPDPLIAPLGSIDLTYGGTVTPGDATAICLADFLGDTNAIVAIAGALDTTSTMAAQAASKLTTDPILSTWVTASAVGPVLTLQSLRSDAVLSLKVNIGNGGTYVYEVGRRKRHFQIVLWTRTPDDRITVGDPIEVLISQLQTNFGLVFSDGSWGRLLYTGDQLRDDATLSDTMRRDFMICVDYAITYQDAVYAILAPIVRNTTF